MKRRRKGPDGGILVLVLIVAVVIVAVIFLILQLRSDPIADSVRDGNPIVVSVLVSDGEKLLCTEVLLFHPTTGKAALFDVPGEWGDVLKKSDRMDRIDLLYKKGSPGEYVEKVSELLALPIPWTIEMDLSQVEAVVDLLGGLELFIANPVEILQEDRMVLLPSGSLLLDGSKVAEYLSYSDPDEADLDRRGRYQKFVQAFFKQIGAQTSYVANDAVFQAFEKVLPSNFGSRALRSFMIELGVLNAEHIVPKHVHGDRVKVDDQVLLFPHFDGKLIRESVRQTLDSLANVELVGDGEVAVVLEVLNGTNTTGLASRTAQMLGGFGYDVLPASNAEKTDYAHTVVISNTSDLVQAQRVADLIRCTRVVMSENENKAISELPDSRADVTLILGMDFDGRYCKE